MTLSKRIAAQAGSGENMKSDNIVWAKVQMSMMDELEPKIGSGEPKETD